MEMMARRSLRAGARAIVARRLDVAVEGLEHLPRHGPLLIACHHAHHLYDGALLLATIPRPLRLFVALDWVTSRRDRLLMEWACGTARWPVVLRAERLQPPLAAPSAYRAEEAVRYLRRAVRESIALLRAGEALVVFPEAYPDVDPRATPKADGTALLPFRPGFVRLAELAQRDGHTRVPIVPAGLAYHRGRRPLATLRFAAPRYVDGRAERAGVLHDVEACVRLLSAASPCRRQDVPLAESVG